MLYLTPDEMTFRREVSSFLEGYRHDHPHEDQSSEHADELYAQIAERGWLGLQWPTDLGGLGRGAIYATIFQEEAGRVRAPVLGASLSSMVGAAMIALDPGMARRYISRIVAGEVIFCLGYSEPAAGSDLASLQTRAELRGEHWVINGTKVFTSLAHRATHMFLAARTSTTLERHRGVSVFVLDLRSPGVTIEKMHTLEGGSVGIVHLDDVQVPATDLVYQVNGGWRVLEEALTVERVGMVALRLGEIRRVVDEVVALAAGANRVDGLVTDIGRIVVAAEVARAAVYAAARNGATAPEAAAVKLVVTSTFEEVARLASRYRPLLEIPVGGSDELKYDVADVLIRSVRYTITGGTSEIQRSIVARQGLGLPRT